MKRNISVTQTSPLRIPDLIYFITKSVKNDGNSYSFQCHTFQQVYLFPNDAAKWLFTTEPMICCGDFVVLKKTN